MLNRAIALVSLAVGGYVLSRHFQRGAISNLSSSEQDGIEVNVPVRVAYNQWTQFEDFPKFMSSVDSVTQVDEKRLHWRANIGGVDKEWDVEITEQIPDTRISWRSVDGPLNIGIVSFSPVTDTSTRVVLKMDYEPQGLLEHVGDTMGAVAIEVRNNLEDFKRFIEARRIETGAWRDSIEPRH